MRPGPEFTSEVGGGKCSSGALSAAFSKAALVSGVTPSNPVAGVIVSATVGGTASVLGGGTFANGAQTAAFGYLFNYCMHFGCTPTDSGNTRDKDKFGRGDYGVSRDNGARRHEGVDYETFAGEAMSSPISGIVTRVNPYRDDGTLTGVQITGDNGVTVRMYYVSPLLANVGQRVDIGELLGYAQDLNARYSGITNHVHVEVRIDGVVKDPHQYFRDGKGK